MELRQRRSAQLLSKRRSGLPVEVDVGHRVDGVVSKRPHVVGVGVVGDVRVTRARRVQTDRVAPRCVRLMGHIRRQADVHRAAQRARIAEAHQPEATFGFLRRLESIRRARDRGRSRSLRRAGSGRCGGSLRHHIHLEAASVALLRLILSRHV